MTAIRTYVPTRERVDGLCPRCMNPALKLYHLVQIDWSGVTVVGERVGCRDDNIWVTKLRLLDRDEREAPRG